MKFCFDRFEVSDSININISWQSKCTQDINNDRDYIVMLNFYVAFLMVFTVTYSNTRVNKYIYVDISKQKTFTVLDYLVNEPYARCVYVCASEGYFSGFTRRLVKVNFLTVNDTFFLFCQGYER